MIKFKDDLEGFKHKLTSLLEDVDGYFIRDLFNNEFTFSIIKDVKVIGDMRIFINYKNDTLFLYLTLINKNPIKIKLELPKKDLPNVFHDFILDGDKHVFNFEGILKSDSRKYRLEFEHNGKVSLYRNEILLEKTRLREVLWNPIFVYFISNKIGFKKCPYFMALSKFYNIDSEEIMTLEEYDKIDTVHPNILDGLKEFFNYRFLKIVSSTNHNITFFQKLNYDKVEFSENEEGFNWEMYCENKPFSLITLEKGNLYYKILGNKDYNPVKIDQPLFHKLFNEDLIEKIGIDVVDLSKTNLYTNDRYDRFMINFKGYFLNIDVYRDWLPSFFKVIPVGKRLAIVTNSKEDMDVFNPVTEIVRKPFKHNDIEYRRLLLF